MLTTKIYEESNHFLFVVTDGTYTFEYRWGKETTEGQTTEVYLQNCKREAELLAQHEIDKMRPPQEITI